MELTAVMPHELTGATFTTPKDLRHLAEQEFGELFVPTEVLEQDAHSATIALRSGGHGRFVVYAERERHWYPYRITHVDGPQRNVRRAG
jgi:hypothetical protein